MGEAECAEEREGGGAVVSEALGEEFAGTLVTDFYGAYNIYDGLKSRFSGDSLW